MIPNMFASNSSEYITFSNGAAALLPEFIGSIDQGNLQREFPSNPNADSVAQSTRRKMLRRAANRKSAQLSRARKKAHLEELKIENERLQRLVDVLDSQPELVFCISVDGRITYYSERTSDFIKSNFVLGEEDSELLHLNQVLSKESVDSVLNSIRSMNLASAASTGDDSVIFASKKVYFNDAFGHPLTGFLRCSKVCRRSTPQFLQRDNDSDGEDENGDNDKDPPADFKKLRVEERANKSALQSTEQPSISSAPLIPLKQENEKNWNLTNFNLLADAVSSFAEHEESKMREASNTAAIHTSTILFAKRDANVNSATNKAIIGSEMTAPTSARKKPRSNSGSTASVSNTKDDHTSQPAPSSTAKKNYQLTRADSQCDEDSVTMHTTTHEPEEYVCIIRTTEACFAPHHSANISKKENDKNNAHNDLYLFSSSLSTASVVAHDREIHNQQRPMDCGISSLHRDSFDQSSGSGNTSIIQPTTHSSSVKLSKDSFSSSDDGSYGACDSSETTGSAAALVNSSSAGVASQNKY